MSARLLVLRHGPTEWNSAGRLQGRRDTPLSDDGREVVARWRLPLETLGWTPLVSPLTRARQTAELMGLKANIADPLIEMDWGRWEGETLIALRAKDPERMAQEEARGLDMTPPEGESPRAVIERLSPFLLDLAKSRTRAVAVTHKGVMRALFAAATGWNMVSRPRPKPSFDAAHLYEIDERGRPYLVNMQMSLLP